MVVDANSYVSDEPDSQLRRGRSRPDSSFTGHLSGILLFSDSRSNNHHETSRGNESPTPDAFHGYILSH
jgi:hypothetical protein